MRRVMFLLMFFVSAHLSMCQSLSLQDLLKLSQSKDYQILNSKARAFGFAFENSESHFFKDINGNVVDTASTYYYFRELVIKNSVRFEELCFDVSNTSKGILTYNTDVQQFINILLKQISNSPLSFKLQELDPIHGGATLRHAYASSQLELYIFESNSNVQIRIHPK